MSMFIFIFYISSVLCILLVRSICMGVVAAVGVKCVSVCVDCRMENPICM